MGTYPILVRARTGKEITPLQANADKSIMNTSNQTEEHRQVAALLNLSIMMLAESSKRMSLDDLLAWIAEMEADRVKVTTDQEYRQRKFTANRIVFSMAALRPAT